MSEVTDTIKAHHREIAKRMNATTERAVRTGSPADLDALLAFLHEDLLPHASGEEAHLYPAIDRLVPGTFQPTATMRIDHEHIQAHARMISAAAARMRTPKDAIDASGARETLRELVTRLAALIDVHLEKEERVYLPFIESALGADAQQRLLEEIHETAAASTNEEPSLDVRPIAHQERHRRIFDTFGALADGASFVLVVDHDPQPLRRHFDLTVPGRYSWEYLEQGPEWRIRIGRQPEVARST
jgi:uncharacterized protein (DUF2249 family)/hemerythrin